MKDPFPSRRRRSNHHPKNVKLLCSFNGTFQPRPPSGKLRYTGGETRIVSVDHNIGFQRLKSKVSELLTICPNTDLCFSLKYKLSVDDDDDAPLVLVTSDEDVREMIDDYDKLESLGKPTRLWIFVCNAGSIFGVLRNCTFEDQSDQIRSYNGDFGLVCEGNEMGLASKQHNSKFEGIPMKTKPLDYEIRNTINQLNDLSQCCLGAVNLQKQPFESNKGLMHKDHNKYELRGVTFGDLDRENIRPCYCNCSSVKSPVAPLSQPQRSCLYYLWSHRNSLFHEVGAQRNARIYGRPWVGKFYPGIRSNSDISKQGHGMRIYYPSSLKPSSRASLDSPRFGVESFPGEGGHGDIELVFPNPKQCHSDDLCFVLNEKISTGKKHEICLHEALSSCDLKVAPKVREQEEASPKDSCFTVGTELQCHDSLAESNGHEDRVNLSVGNLSLSSPKEDESLAGSPPTDNLRDDEHLCSDPQVQMPNGIASDTSQSKAISGKADEQISDIQPEKVEVIESCKSYKENDTISGGLAAIYSHLASRELQTIKSSDLEYIKELGSGTYGTVLYGKWRGCDVAIKKLKPSCFTEDGPEQDRLVADFWKEAHILGGLHHPHVVALYGVVADGPVTNLATVTEYMVNGSLKQVLRRKDRTIDRRKRMIIAMDAAFGMEYLHEKNIVHFDLKSHNLLVNMRDPQRPVCKIGDLGLSKIKQRTMVSGGVRGTLPWMAPELLNCTKNMVTEKVDVYSFGIVMWELLTGEEPYATMRSEEIIAGIIKGDLRPEVPNWCDPAWRSLMEKCWSSDPDSRPSFSEISKELRAMSASMNIK